MDSFRYYQNSGRFSLIGLIIGTVIIVLIAGLLAALYAIIDRYNPFIYINFLATLFLGAFVGAGVLFAVNVGKVRSPSVKWFLALFGAFFAVYVNWVVYLYSLSNYEYLFFDPVLIFNVLVELGEQGTWSFKSTKPTGWGLYSIWLLEAGVIIGSAINTVKGENDPFCEGCENWLEEVEGVMALVPVGDKESFVRDMENENYDRLLQFDRFREGTGFTQVDLFICSSCEEGPHYLTVKDVQFKTDSDGKVEREDSFVVKNLSISKSCLDQITERVQKLSEEAEAEDAEESEGEEDPVEEGAEDSPQ